MQLDHVTIVTGDLEAARHFFCVVAGLAEGPRPPFGVSGHWFYAEGRPVIHLVEAPLAAGQGRVAPRIDHVAFRLHGWQQWESLVGRLHANHVPYSVSEVPLAAEVQLFVSLAPGVTIEFVAAMDASRT
jgi:catechol 2,3-dioxygenase-like lactoylglutathione lyase family enzyme